MPSSLIKQTDGKLARYIHDSITEPFNLNDWQPSAQSTKGIGGSGQLQWTQGAGARGLIHTAVPARAKALLQARVTQADAGSPSTNTSVYVGVIGSLDPQLDIDGYAKAKAIGPNTGGGLRVSFLNRVINSQGSGAVTGAEGTALHNVFHRLCCFADASPGAEANRVLLGWNNVDNQLLNGQPTIDMTLLTGQAWLARFNSTASLAAECDEFYYAADRDVGAIGGLPDGWKLQLRNVGESVLAQTVVSGGTGQAAVDLMTPQIWMADIAAVVVVNASDVEQARATPAGGVWGGDVYLFTLGGIDAPTVTPAPQATWARATGSTFVSANPEPHFATDWQLTLATDPTFAAPLASFRSFTSLLTVDFNGLSPSTNYLVRARYVDSALNESAYGAAAPFTTLSQANQVLLPDGTVRPVLTVDPLQDRWVGLDT